MMGSGWGRRHRNLAPAPADGLVPLSALEPGERAEVARVHCGRALVCRLSSHGFTPGAEVELVQNFGRGPVIALVRGARVALGRGEAEQLFVRRKAA